VLLSFIASTALVLVALPAAAEDASALPASAPPAAPAAPAPAPAAAVQVAKGPTKILVLDLRFEDVSEKTARVMRDEIVVDLDRDAAIEVLSSEDVRAVMDVEASKRSMGCDDTSCLAEVGSALGARYVVHGSLGRIGSTTFIHLNLFDTEQARAVARETAEAKSDDELVPALRGALLRLRLAMGLAPAPPPPPEEGGGPSTLLLAGGGVAGLGVLAAGAGAVLMVLAWPTYSSVALEKDGGPSDAARADAQAMGIAGTLVVGAGAAIVAVGGVLVVWGVME
jgi:TolB-like protein